VAAGREIVVPLDPGRPLRYVRFDGTPDKVLEIEGYLDGTRLDRSRWRASNLLAHYSRVRPRRAWQRSFTLDEVPRGSYLAIALAGEHGPEGAYAAIRVDGVPVGAPDRSVSFPSNSWEYPPRTSASNYTYYVPLTEAMIGAQIDAVVLGMRNGSEELAPEVWITAYPAPFSARELTLIE
jgi:hypothetical protein